MNEESNSCETTDTFACEDYTEEEPQLCELDKSKTYKGLVGIYVDETLITLIDGLVILIRSMLNLLNDN